MNQFDSTQYAAPEIFELGSADELTLGSCSCAADDCGCGKKAADEA
jgi:hypothetical protein